jgi:hypothetical protein
LNLKSKFTGKSREPGSHKFDSHKLGSHKFGLNKLGSHKFGSHKLGSRVILIFFRFTFFQSSHISREPVNLGSHITHAPVKEIIQKNKLIILK